MLDRPDSWLVAVMLWAATWRVTHLLMYESGPYKIVRRLREATGVRHDKDFDLPIAYPDGNVFECFWCLSIWIAIAAGAAAIWAWPVLAVLAASAAAIWAEEWYNGTRKH